MSRSTLDAIAKCMNGVFREAVKNDIVQKNYANMITLPEAKKSTIHKPFTEEEVDILWQHTDNKYAKALLIYIYTGMRPIEFFEMKLERTIISSKQSLVIHTVEMLRLMYIPIKR